MMRILELRLRPGLVTLILAVIVTITLLGLRDYMLDDAFITYRYARNLAEGHGMTFNIDEKVLGTTTPGYTALLALLYTVTHVDFPILSLVVTILATTAGGLLTYLILRSWLSDFAAFVGALLLVTHPILSRSLGMETSTYILAILAAAYFSLVKQNNILSGVAVGLAILIRPDGAVAAVIPMAAWVLRKITFRDLFIMGVVSVIVLIPWLLYAFAFFGSPIPQTIIAKSHHVGLGAESSMFIRGFGFLPREYLGRSLLYLLIVPFGLLGAYDLVRRRPVTGIALLVWAVLYTIGFEILNVPNHFIWYWAPLLIGLVVILASGVDRAILLIKQRLASQQPLLNGVAFAVVAALAVVVLVQVVHSDQAIVDSPRFYTYKDVAEYLEELTQPGDLIAAWEIGVIGYYADRKILDLVGLISPVITENGGDKAIEMLQPVYVVDGAYPGYALDKVFPVHTRTPDNTLITEITTYKPEAATAASQ